MKRKKSKGVLMGQVFIYITAVIIFAVILIFGYQAIAGFLEKGEKVAYLTFKTDLENAIKTVYSDYGTVVIYNERNVLSIPGGYKEVCFIDLGYDPNKRSTAGICQSGSDYRPLVCDAWKGVTWESGDQNVFLEPMGLSPIKVYKITLDTFDDDLEDNIRDQGYLCIPIVQGRLHMRLEGMGDHTFISKFNVTA